LNDSLNLRQAKLLHRFYCNIKSVVADAGAVFMFIQKFIGVSSQDFLQRSAHNDHMTHACAVVSVSVYYCGKDSAGNGAVNLS